MNGKFSISYNYRETQKRKYHSTPTPRLQKNLIYTKVAKYLSFIRQNLYSKSQKRILNDSVFEYKKESDSGYQ